MPPCGADGSGAAPPPSGGGGIDVLLDEVLHHILGFLEAHEAVRTCVLAKRWRHLWRHATGLRVVADTTSAFLGSVDKAWEFLDHLLPLREGSPLQTCELGFDTLGFNKTVGLLDDDGTCRVNNWFWHAVMHKVRDLRFYALLPDYWIQLDDMPLNSQYLTRLEFTGVEVYSNFLNFSNCPALEYLQFQRCKLSYNITSKSLKRLIITWCSFWGDSRIHICAPNLVSFCIEDSSGKTPVLESMPSLVAAFIDLYQEPEYSCSKVCHCEFCDNTYVIGDSIGSNNSILLRGLSKAKNLTLKSRPKTFLFKRELRWCPMFSKLKTLLLNDNWCVPNDFRALVCLLEHSSVLEKLTLELSSKRTKRYTIIIGDVRPMEGSTAILEHLKLVEVKCKVVDERIFKLGVFLCAFNIRFDLGVDL